MANGNRVDNLESGEFVVVNARDVDLAVKVCVDDARIVPDDAAIGSPVHESAARGPRNGVGDSVAKRDRIVGISLEGMWGGVTSSHRRHHFRGRSMVQCPVGYPNSSACVGHRQDASYESFMPPF